MTGKIFAFPTERAKRLVSRTTAAAPVFSEDWGDRHMPLIEAAMDLLQVDDAEFGRRLHTMAGQEGKQVLTTLAGQIDKLAAHVIGIANALAMTAMRIRTTMATGGAGA